MFSEPTFRNCNLVETKTLTRLRPDVVVHLAGDRAVQMCDFYFWSIGVNYVGANLRRARKKAYHWSEKRTYDVPQGLRYSMGADWGKSRARVTYRTP